MISTETFFVENIKCDTCSKKITAAISLLNGVHAVRVYPQAQKVCVMGIGLDRHKLIHQLGKLGYPLKGANSAWKQLKTSVLCAVR
jgi:copper chaperone